MKKTLIISFVICNFLVAASVFCQSPQMAKRTVTRSDSFEFAAGGTVAVNGAPNGSIRVVGANVNQIEITAVIHLEAPTEKDLDVLASVTGFMTDEALGRTGIISYGTYNKLGDKKMWKKFPKNLLNLPIKIDYVVSVPHYCDLEINGGKGDLSISGVEGSLSINFLETNAKIDVLGGAMTATVGSGKVDVALGVKGWRARVASIQVGTGDLTVKLPSNTSAEIDANILRTGTIENMLTDLKPRDRKVPFTERSIMAKAGVGGVELKFTVGDGTLRMERLTPSL